MPNQRLNKNYVLKKRLIQSLKIKIDLLLKYKPKAFTGDQIPLQHFSIIPTQLSPD